PDGVVAYSPSFRQVIDAETRRRQPGKPLVQGPQVTLYDRINAANVDAVPALVEALEPRNAHLQATALEGLTALHLEATRDRLALSSIAAHAHAVDAAVRTGVIATLGRARSHVSLIAEAMHDQDFRVREAAMVGIGNLGDPSYLSDLSAAVFFDPTPRVRKAALRAVAELHSPTTIPVLFAALERNRPGDVEIAGAALISRGLSQADQQRLVNLLIIALRDDGVYWNGERARALLRFLGESAATSLLRAALDDADYQCRQAVAGLLRQMEDDPSERLVAVTIEGMLTDRSTPDRPVGIDFWGNNVRACVRWLVTHPGIGDAPLRTALGTTDVQQRFYAAWLLAMRGDATSTEAICRELMPRLRADHVSADALWAIRALYRLGPTAAPVAQATLATADEQQAAYLNLLLRDWSDPPCSRIEAAKRGRVKLSILYHDPAWEPTLEPLGALPNCLPFDLR
ncbi:MAG TPA: HEAT repeat domain-containing protein, partial [Planctomycetota bacterium]|nr:HEAT repeat domain-containing protein [Planctomycetota bacterium]